MHGLLVPYRSTEARSRHPVVRRDAYSLGVVRQRALRGGIPARSLALAHRQWGATRSAGTIAVAPSPCTVPSSCQGVVDRSASLWARSDRRIEARGGRRLQGRPLRREFTDEFRGADGWSSSKARRSTGSRGHAVDASASRTPLRAILRPCQVAGTDRDASKAAATDFGVRWLGILFRPIGQPGWTPQGRAGVSAREDR